MRKEGTIVVLPTRCEGAIVGGGRYDYVHPKVEVATVVEAGTTVQRTDQAGTTALIPEGKCDRDMKHRQVGPSFILREGMTTLLRVRQARLPLRWGRHDHERRKVRP